ncbi:MAG: hypothetical protein F4226_08955 [Synechococcus sp. SB0678_bin_12]|nr:hypothetical protein [Synechococcus sp. SB0678_bin_12]
MQAHIERRKLPIIVDGKVKSDETGVYVNEHVTLFLDRIKDDLKNIIQIEVQVGPDEYLWKPDPVLTKKILNFEEP